MTAGICKIAITTTTCCATVNIITPGPQGPQGEVGPTGATGPTGVVTATAPISYNSGTQTVSTSMATSRLLGRTTAGTGVAEEISIGTGLSLSAGTLSNSAVTPPGGSNTQVQFNDSSAFGGDVDLTWNKTTNVLTVAGDVNLSDGGTYTTTLQTITPTAARTISLPDATGTVALVAGSSGQVVYNNAGVNAGASTLTYDGSILTTSGRFINSYNATASSPAKAFTGTWFTGGTSTTTKPQVLIEPTGATSTAWSTSGTGFGVNAASGFAGNLLDLQLNGSSVTTVNSVGAFIQSCTGQSVTTFVLRNLNADFNNSLFYGYTSKGTSPTFRLLDLRTGNGSTEIFNVDGSGNTNWANGANFVFGTGTGTKIGTATTQKIGFYNKTPVVQPTAVADATSAIDVITQFNALLSRMRDLGLIAF